MYAESLIIDAVMLRKPVRTVQQETGVTKDGVREEKGL